MIKSLDLKLTSAHLITIILWASAFPGIRAALTAYSPEHVSLLRLLIGSLILILVAAIQGIRLPELKDVPIILLLGSLGFSVYQTALNYGEQTISAGVASLLVSTTPIFTALLALLFFREKFGFWGWVGSLIGFSGVAFISLGGTTASFSLNIGIILVLVASLSESIYFVFQNAYLKKYGFVPFTMYTIWSGTIFLMIFSPGLGEAIIHAPIDITLVVIYLGIFPTIIPYFTLAYITSQTGASEATSSLYLTPVVAFLIAWIWLGELPTIYAIIGGLITLGGVFLSNMKKTD
ncbi:Permease of the drug/metabolite transporter (DMT) superfamily [Gracilibacillus orientalis]|uniref:Permease of the drug/metabolite transporter (DMT) superfamily n=1 Tax=Gracilibacillus orientalis TaxID=334253 RepID=A0A1I4J7C6_9BACI|nr:DMT family transporter [Gracilibacillus orientalis]SFL61986.1 Permease of the drug/metabolite transporter (DMT) superfamily [Gracilibacillus orientalis]